MDNATNTALLALLGYASWTLLLLVVITLLRTGLTLSGRKAANSFAVAGDDVSPFSARLCRAHANCYENLPVFAGILLVGVVSGNAALVAPLALWALAARVAQSVVHIISTSVPAVMLRFTFLLVQMLIQLYWAYLLVQALL